MSPKLISTIIAIIIGILATLAGIRYGGTAFNDGRAKAEALTVLNAAEQVKGAADLYFNLEGEYAEDDTDPADGALNYQKLLTEVPEGNDVTGVYLTEEVRLPDGASIGIVETTVTITGINDAACEVLDEDGYACVDNAGSNELTF